MDIFPFYYLFETNKLFGSQNMILPRDETQKLFATAQLFYYFILDAGASN